MPLPSSGSCTLSTKLTGPSNCVHFCSCFVFYFIPFPFSSPSSPYFTYLILLFPISGLDKSISIFLFLLFFFSAAHLFIGFHLYFTWAVPHLGAGVVEGIFPHPSTNSSSCLPVMPLVFFLLVLIFLSPLLSCYISFLCDFSNMWNTHSYFHSTVILAPICLKKLEDKLTELFFMTWIFEYLQFKCTWRHVV
jgi:hypothetical protein